jgi:hypothetical protein
MHAHAEGILILAALLLVVHTVVKAEEYFAYSTEDDAQYNCTTPNPFGA